MSDQASLDALAAQVAELSEQHDVNSMKSSVTSAEGTRKVATVEANTNAAAAAAAAEGGSIFVGGLDARTTEQDLRAIFGGCGTIRRLTIVRDRNQAPKGHAFVEFEESTAIAKAMLKNNQTLHGRAMKVTQKIDFAAQNAASSGGQPGQQQQAGGQQQQPGGFRGGRGGGGAPGAPGQRGGRGGHHHHQHYQHHQHASAAANPMMAMMNNPAVAGNPQMMAMMGAMAAAMMGGTGAGVPFGAGGGVPGGHHHHHHQGHHQHHHHHGRGRAGGPPGGAGRGGFTRGGAGPGAGGAGGAPPGAGGN